MGKPLGNADIFSATEMMKKSKRIFCVGSVLWDVIGHTETVLGLGYDTEGRIFRRAGGVAFNIAKKLAEFGERPIMLTILGNDAAGKALCDVCYALGFDTRFIHLSEHLPTDQYMAIEDKNGLVAAIADTHLLECEGDQILQTLLDPKHDLLHTPQEVLLILDGNFTQAQLANISSCGALKEVTLFVAPASPGKVDRLKCFFKRPKTVLFCNLSEAETLAARPLSDAECAVEILLELGFDRVIVTNGANMACDGARNTIALRQTPTPVKLRGVTGAGDVFMASYIHHDMNGATRQTALAAAIEAAGNYVSGQIET